MFTLLALAGCATATSPAAPPNTQSAESTAPSTNAAVVSEEVLKKALATGENQAHFWTGRVNGVSVEKQAGEIAKAAGGATLESKLTEASITMPVFSDRSPEAVSSWTSASRIFAELASGTVTVVMGTELRQGNVFETQELPVLKANPKIVAVMKLDAATGQKTTLYTR